MVGFGIYLKSIQREKKDRETNNTVKVDVHYFAVVGDDDDDMPKIGKCDTEVGAFKANLGDKVSFKQKIKEWDGRSYVAYSNLKLAK